ncbi:alpha/beta hydrolase [Variovorax ureilyticus]|uniref:Alpha/beta hydrolase n=1 Tax=Variovorax ureilyticus TaxID=1836198 RepID=A0ABU8VPX8_9BURK
MEKRVTFQSGEFTLAGVLHVPEGLSPGERRPGIIVLHGFGGNKEGPPHVGECRLHESLGYVALRFDMRGCGESGGAKGRVLCEEQVQDTASAVTWLGQQDFVDPGAIVVSGQSNGGAVAIYSGAMDPRVAAVISIGGWGDRARKLEWQNRADGAWERLLRLMQEGRDLRERTRETLMIKRWDIVPVPESIRHLLPPGCVMDFPVDTPQSIYDFRPEEVAARIAPRPFLIVHGANDSVTHVFEAIRLFQAVEGKAEMAILKGDHFPFVEPDPLLDGVVAQWLARNVPIAATKSPSSETLDPPPTEPTNRIHQPTP